MAHVNELTPYTFKDTGRQVMIRKVSPMSLLDLSRQFPPPDAPVQEVDYGNGKKVLEENKAHPDYLEALRQYEIEQNNRAQRLLIKRGVELTDKDEAAQAVKELREFWLEEFKVELPEKDDKLVFVLQICAGTQEDVTELIEAITKRSRATELQISEAQGIFPG